MLHGKVLQPNKCLLEAATTSASSKLEGHEAESWPGRAVVSANVTSQHRSQATRQTAPPRLTYSASCYQSAGAPTYTRRSDPPGHEVVVCRQLRSPFQHGGATHWYAAISHSPHTVLTQSYSPRWRHRVPQGWLCWPGMPQAQTSGLQPLTIAELPRGPISLDRGPTYPTNRRAGRRYCGEGHHVRR